MKRMLSLVIAGALAAAALAGCSKNSAAPGSSSNSAAPSGTDSGSSISVSSQGAAKFDSAKEIGVTSREEGSGTRGAFIELFGIEKKDASGNKVDHTTQEAAVTNNTSVMMTSVAGDLYSIGYISLGSLNDTVKAADIDGVAASVENIKNGSYKIARPFNIVTTKTVSAGAQDFISFIMSADGQSVIEKAGYIAVSQAPAYSGALGSGKIVVAGSSSVTPVMEKLKEAYLAKNPGVTIEVQQSDSSTGITNAADGVCDIGMASRELKDSEIQKGLTPTVIAMDGIAVILNNDAPVTGLTSQQVMQIFTGEVTTWSQIVG